MESIPEDIEGPVRALEERAHDGLSRYTNRKVSQDRISLCARLLAAARRTPIFMLPPGNFVDEAPYDYIGMLYGLENKNRTPERTAKVHRRGRAAFQRVNSSAKSALDRIRKLEQVFARYAPDLPAIYRDQYKVHAHAASMLVRELFIATHVFTVENLIERKRSKNQLERWSPENGALVWWYDMLSREKSPYWEDSFALAAVWNLTACREVDSYRRSVMRLATGRPRSGGILLFPPPPEWSLL